MGSAADCRGSRRPGPRRTGSAGARRMTAATDRPVLITGGAGFIGCNLAHALAREGHSVLIYDSLARPGVERNLAWLKAEHRKLIHSVEADVRDRLSLVEAVRDA